MKNFSLVKELPPEDPLSWLDMPLPKKRVPAVTDTPGASAVPVESPFIPGTRIQYAWDSTSLGYFKRCPRFYQYKMIEGWKQDIESFHLTFGILYHAALQDYEIALVDGADHEEAIRTALYKLLISERFEWLAQVTEPDPNKNRSTLVRTVIQYCDQFQYDPTKVVTLANGRPALEHSFRFEIDIHPKTSDDRQYMLSGHLDRVCIFHDDPYVMDRKTTKYALAKRYFLSYSPDNQISLYSFAGRLLFGTQVQGVIIDAAQILVGETKFARFPVDRNEQQLDEWLVDLECTLDQAEQCAVRGYWPQNDTSCDKYGGCEFRHICSLSPEQRANFLPGSHKKGEPWNPLKPR